MKRWPKSLKGDCVRVKTPLEPRVTRQPPPRRGEEGTAEQLQADSQPQTDGMNSQLEATCGVGLGSKRNHQLGTPEARERRSAIAPPPRSWILVDKNLFARIDLENHAIRAPVDWFDTASSRPGLALIVRMFPRPAERRSVAPVSQHRFVSLNHTVTTHDARVSEASAYIDDRSNLRAREESGLWSNAEGQRQLLVGEGYVVDADNRDQQP